MDKRDYRRNTARQRKRGKQHRRWKDDNKKRESNMKVDRIKWKMLEEAFVSEGHANKL